MCRTEWSGCLPGAEIFAGLQRGDADQRTQHRAVNEGAMAATARLQQCSGDLAVYQDADAEQRTPGSRRVEFAILVRNSQGIKRRQEPTRPH